MSERLSNTGSVPAPPSPSCVDPIPGGDDLYHQYIGRLCGLAAQLIGERLGRQYTVEDAAHSALGSFFRGVRDGRYPIEPVGRLWSLLATILRHKIQRRGGKAKEELLSGDMAHSDPPPERAAEMADAIQMALEGLKPNHLEICRLFYAEGLSLPDIVTCVGRSRWTVRRVLNEFGRRLEKYLSLDVSL